MYTAIKLLKRHKWSNNLLSDQALQPVLSHQTCQAHPNYNRNKMQQLFKSKFYWPPNLSYYYDMSHFQRSILEMNPPIYIRHHCLLGKNVSIWRISISLLTVAPLGPGNPMTPGCPRAPCGPGGPGRPSSPGAPYSLRVKSNYII